MTHDGDCCQIPLAAYVAGARRDLAGMGFTPGHDTNIIHHLLLEIDRIEAENERLKAVLQDQADCYECFRVHDEDCPLAAEQNRLAYNSLKALGYVGRAPEADPSGCGCP